MLPEEIIIAPVVTEKSMNAMAEKKTIAPITTMGMALFKNTL